MRTSTSDLGCGLFFTQSPNGQAKFEVHDINELRTALGPRILTAFCQCFFGTDQLRSLVHAMNMNNEHTPVDSVQRQRNLLSLVLLSWV